MTRWLQVGFAALVLGLVAGLAPAEAATRPPVVRPSMTLHNTWNCGSPHVEADFYKVSGPKDVYVQTDHGRWLIARGFVFDPTKVYDGNWSTGGNYQTEMWVTPVGAGPYSENRSPQKSTAPFACPYWGDVPFVYPSPPAGSVPITFTYIEWYPND
jgi:hypothetical protein